MECTVLTLLSDSIHLYKETLQAQKYHLVVSTLDQSNHTQDSKCLCLGTGAELMKHILLRRHRPEGECEGMGKCKVHGSDSQC